MRTSSSRVIDICLSIKGYKSALFLGIGGGGDVATAATLTLAYERCGGRSVIGSIVWERYVVDLVPGPIRLEELHEVVERGDGYAVVNRNTYAIRGGRRVIPQAVKVADILDREVVVFDIYRGPRGLAKALEEFAQRYGIEAIVGVDVGGDAIAEGFEESLWSPLADAIVVAALAHLDNAYVAIASPGADGELPQEYVEQRIRKIAQLGGYVGGYVFSAKDIEILKMMLERVVSEASAIPLKLFETDQDVIYIRDGSRKVKLSLVNLAVFILNSITVARASIARYVFEADNFDEARNILNKLLIVTEYDIEEEIYRELNTKGFNTKINLVEIRDKLKKKLLKLHINATHY
ncbi:MAG: DUF1152 domain-containing protein [Desulfurococcaceae archaeon]|nr:DUF1152 domain-containing protein [Desulfurococcaceae archaeon]